MLLDIIVRKHRLDTYYKGKDFELKYRMIEDYLSKSIKNSEVVLGMVLAVVIQNALAN